MTDFMPYNEDQELDNNTSDNTHFRDILEQRMSRRSLIKKTASGAAALALASSLSACSDDDEDTNVTPPTSKEEPNTKPETLTFKAVDKNLKDIVTVPEGYQATV